MDDRMFRNAMGMFATGVTVITTTTDNEVHGMTANAFMSVSLTPKLVLISIGEKAKMLSKIKESNKFVVNLLSDQQKEVSMQFAGQLKENIDVDFSWSNDLPLIKDSLASIVCDVYSYQVAGDHTLFIGEVKDLVLNDGEPLTFYKGKYGGYAAETLV
ncbi:flavin reductase family protein [Bacillus massiliigorillae]|uniref:flavin reductase family protein n=1 Tax=Bacillus massiliigorillae TaxID=1243664 RepID=UPI0003AA084A|nr:flavin reductase family protein [Bacillus massiliigorillae]